MEDTASNSGKRPHTTVVVMAFNEEETLESVVHEILEESRIAGVDTEVDIVDDGSTDGTPEIAARLANLHASVRHLRHTENGGWARCIVRI